MSNYTLNARNMICPLPIIKAQERIAELQTGDVLKVYCTDHGALNDLPAWCRLNGHEVKEARESDYEVTITIIIG